MKRRKDTICLLPTLRCFPLRYSSLCFPWKTWIDCPQLACKLSLLPDSMASSLFRTHPRVSLNSQSLNAHVLPSFMSLLLPCSVSLPFCTQAWLADGNPPCWRFCSICYFSSVFSASSKWQQIPYPTLSSFSSCWGHLLPCVLPVHCSVNVRCKGTCPTIFRLIVPLRTSLTSLFLETCSCRIIDCSLAEFLTQCPIIYQSFSLSVCLPACLSIYPSTLF